MNAEDAPSAYPLQWPVGRPRTHNRKRSGFGKREPGQYGKVKLTVADALSRLRRELTNLGAEQVIVSSNIPNRRDGMPYSNVSEPSDPGVAVYFRIRGEPRSMACDAWDRVADNIAAIAAHVEAIRGQLRWKVADVAALFAGFRALPAMGAVKPWWEVMRFEDDDVTVDEVKERYVSLAKKHHPDHGGTQTAMAELNAAYDEALRQVQDNR